MHSNELAYGRKLKKPHPFSGEPVLSSVRIISTTGRARSETERRRAFFYAEAQAGNYDAAADLNTPLYSLLQKTLFDLVVLHCKSRPAGVPFVFLDIGSGTGAEALPILQAYPESRVVAFDLCEPMHTMFRAKAVAALGEDAVRERCQFITGDIAGEEGEVNQLLGHLAQWGDRGHYDMVISSLALHHLTTEEKYNVTKRIGRLLERGGLFLNGDVFSYSSPTMARNANNFGVDWIRRNFTDPPEDLRPLKEALGDKALMMGEAWVDHYVNYNMPDTVDSLQRTHVSRPTADQAQMLANVGFSEVAVPFRFWELGILWAQK